MQRSDAAKAVDLPAQFLGKFIRGMRTVGRKVGAVIGRVLALPRNVTPSGECQRR
jgi:hypothetical protein